MAGLVTGCICEMKTFPVLAVCLGAGLFCAPVHAQTTNEIEALRRQLEDANRQFEQTVEQHRRLIESLQQRMDALAPPGAPAGTNVVSAPPPAASAQSTPRPVWSPADPLRLAGNERNYLNLSLSGLFALGYSTAEEVEELQLGGHDPTQRGFTVQNVEATFEGKIDPYFRGQSSIIFLLDPDGETAVELEEAYLESLSLPANLQLKAGQFFSEFGRLNPTHPHTWDFVDQPLVNGRFFGGDGLRNPGARLSWLAPTPFYSELMLGVQNSHGETAFSFRTDHEEEPYLGRLHDVGRVKSFGDLLFVPRYAASWNLSDEQTLLAGASAAFGPNASGASADTQIDGLDLFWKWKPVNHHAGFPFVSWQTEAMLRRYQAASFDWDLDQNGALDPGEVDADNDGVPDLLPGEHLIDYGFYSQLAYGFRKGWVAGLRGDLVTSRRGDYERAFGRDPDRATRWRLAPNLTWYPTEYSKFRLQYNYDDRGGPGTDHSVWLQFEFLLGAHAAHRF